MLVQKCDRVPNRVLPKLSDNDSTLQWLSHFAMRIFRVCPLTYTWSNQLSNLFSFDNHALGCYLALVFSVKIWKNVNPSMPTSISKSSGHPYPSFALFVCEHKSLSRSYNPKCWKRCKGRSTIWLLWQSSMMFLQEIQCWLRDIILQEIATRNLCQPT